MDSSFSDRNYTPIIIDNAAMFPSIETLPGFEARETFLYLGKAFRVNPANSATPCSMSSQILRLILLTIRSHAPWVGDFIRSHVY